MNEAELPADAENKNLAASLHRFFKRDLKAEYLIEVANLIRVMSHQMRANLTYGVFELDTENDGRLPRETTRESPKNALLRLRAVARRSSRSGDWEEFVKAWATVSSVVHEKVWGEAPARWYVLQKENTENFVGFVSSKVSFIVPRPEIATSWIENVLLNIKEGRTGRQSRYDLDELILFLIAVYRAITGNNSANRCIDGSYLSGGIHEFVGAVSSCINIGFDKDGRKRELLGPNDERRLRRIIREIRIGGRLYGAYAKQQSIVSDLSTRFEVSHKRH